MNQKSERERQNVYMFSSAVEVKGVELNFVDRKKRDDNIKVLYLNYILYRCLCGL